MDNSLEDSLKKALEVLDGVVGDVVTDMDKKMEGLSEQDRKELKKNPDYIKAMKDLENLNIDNIDLNSWQ